MRCFLFGLLFASPLWAEVLAVPDESQGTLIVQVDGFISRDGLLRVLLFDRDEGFPSNADMALRRISVPMQSFSGGVRFEGLPFGSYAVGVYQDMNDNRRLDKNLMGIPSEPVAVSNNPRIRFGPPKFSAARFDFTSTDTSILIRLPRSASQGGGSRP